MNCLPACHVCVTDRSFPVGLQLIGLTLSRTVFLISVVQNSCKPVGASPILDFEVGRLAAVKAARQVGPRW